MTPKTKTSITPKTSLKETIDIKPKNANPLSDYISLSMDLVKLEVFLLEKLDIDKKDKQKFVKEHLDQQNIALLIACIVVIIAFNKVIDYTFNSFTRIVQKL